MEKLFGIDISHWQGDMSIEQARNERGVRFAIIKAAGADDGKYKDSKFENYYAQCKAIGLPVGAYYYGNAKSVTEAEQEADHFLSVIAGKQFEYPIYSFSYGVDWRDLLGQDPEYIRPEMKRMIQETLLEDDRISEVDNFSFEFSGNVCRCTFDVVSIFGITREEAETSV